MQRSCKQIFDAARGHASARAFAPCRGQPVLGVKPLPPRQPRPLRADNGEGCNQIPPASNINAWAGEPPAQAARVQPFQAAQRSPNPLKLLQGLNLFQAPGSLGGAAAWVAREGPLLDQLKAKYGEDLGWSLGDPRVRDEVEAALAGVEVLHTRSGESRTLSGKLAGAAGETLFKKRGTTVTVAQHFENQYGTPLRHPDLPCALVGRKGRIALPLEVLTCTGRRTPHGSANEHKVAAASTPITAVAAAAATALRLQEGPLLEQLQAAYSDDLARALVDTSHAAGLQAALSGIQVVSCHTRLPNKLSGKLGRPATEHPVDWDGRCATVAQYFEERYGIALRHPELPCALVDGDGKVALPLEMLMVERSPRRAGTDPGGEGGATPAGAPPRAGGLADEQRVLARQVEALFGALQALVQTLARLLGLYAAALARRVKGLLPRALRRSRESSALHTAFYEMERELLRPDVERETRARKTVNSLYNILQHMPFLKVDRVHKGGSFGRGTSVDEFFDVDLLAFVSAFEERQLMWPENWHDKPLLRQMRKRVKKWLEQGCWRQNGLESLASDIKVVKVEGSEYYRYVLKVEVDGMEVDLLLVPCRAHGGGSDDGSTVASRQRDKALFEFGGPFTDPAGAHYDVMRERAVTESLTEFITKSFPSDVLETVKLVKAWYMYGLKPEVPDISSVCLEMMVITAYQELKSNRFRTFLRGEPTKLELLKASLRKVIKVADGEVCMVTDASREYGFTREVIMQFKHIWIDHPFKIIHPIDPTCNLARDRSDAGKPRPDVAGLVREAEELLRVLDSGQASSLLEHSSLAMAVRNKRSKQRADDAVA